MKDIYTQLNNRLIKFNYIASFDYKVGNNCVIVTGRLSDSKRVYYDMTIDEVKELLSDEIINIIKYSVSINSTIGSTFLRRY